MVFSNIAACDSMITQALSDRLYIIPHRNAVCHHAVCVWKGSCKNCTPRRSAYRLTRICVFISNALRCQAVQIRSLHFLVTIASYHIFSRGIRHQKYNLSFHVLSSPISYLLSKFCKFIVPLPEKELVSFAEIILIYSISILRPVPHAAATA